MKMEKDEWSLPGNVEDSTLPPQQSEGHVKKELSVTADSGFQSGGSWQISERKRRRESDGDWPSKIPSK